MHASELLLETLRFNNDEKRLGLYEKWRSVDTSGLSDLLMMEGGALWLYRRLANMGGTSAWPVNERFRTWLKRTAHHISARNLLVDASACKLLEILSEANVPHILLKGTARRAASHVYSHADSRATSDIDILVPQTDAHALWQLLTSRGYAYEGPPRTLPPGYHELLPLNDEAGVSVDIHISTIPSVAPEEAWRRAVNGGTALTHKGVPTRVSSATELMWHGATHALRHGLPAYRLRFLLDSASILASEASIDWDLIEPRLETEEVPGRRRTIAWLGAAAWLAGTELPEEFSRGIPAFPLERIIRWRLSVVRRFRFGGRIAEKLLDEGTRCEANMPLTQAVDGTSLLIRSRRKSAAFFARVAYLSWRMAQGR